MTDNTSKQGAQRPGAGTTTTLLDRVLEKGFRAKTPAQKTEAKKDIEALIQEVTRGVPFGSKKVDKALQARIDEIDALLSKQVAAILHDQSYTKLEASWRGLHYLVHQSNTSPMLKVRVLNCKKSEIGSDLEDASEFDQSSLWSAIYEAEYGTFGGSPFGALVGDFER